MKDIKIAKRKGVAGAATNAGLGTAVEVRGGEKSGGHAETVGGVAAVGHFERQVRTHD